MVQGLYKAQGFKVRLKVRGYGFRASGSRV